MEIKVKLVLERETRNTVRYQEVGEPHRIYTGVVYIHKTAFGFSGDYPHELEITIASPAKPKLGVVS